MLKWLLGNDLDERMRELERELLYEKWQEKWRDEVLVKRTQGANVSTFTMSSNEANLIYLGMPITYEINGQKHRYM